MNSKDFTYYFMEDMLIDTIRVIYRKEYVVLTLYYPYQTLKFKNIIKKYQNEESIIYEWQNEHTLDLHKDDKTPFDWHVHITLKKELLQNFLIDLFKENNLPDKELNNIISYLKDPSKKIKNIEFEGSKNNKALRDFVKAKQYSLFVYNIVKKEIVSEYVILLSLYLTRFNIFEFKMTNKLLQILKKYRIKNKTKKEIKKYISDKNLDNYNIIYKEKKIVLNLNKAYIEFLSTFIYSFNSFFLQKRYVNLKTYMTLRMNMELSWSLFQSSKIMKQLGYTSYEDFLKSKPKVEKLETYLVKAYFIFYTRFQTCINLETSVEKECLLQVNLSDAKFKRAMDICYQKIKLTDNERLKFTSTSVISPFI
tara:strand:- start:1098 stop:2192 length:1095 start_codon:yes stop_codon:yes gene_type:complete